MKLNELRRSSATMPKQSGLRQLLSYVKTLSADQINKTFVSFTSIDKLGINPNSEYVTPNGIYAYRLEYVLQHAKKLTNVDQPFSKIVPFAGSAPYFNVFQVEGNILRIGDSKGEIEALKKANAYALADAHARGVPRKKLPDSYHSETLAQQVWWTTLFIANGNSATPISTPEIARKWATVFRKIGIQGVVDPGTRTIHGNEPDQAVFFTTEVIKNVKRFVNTKHDGSISKHAPPHMLEVGFFFKQKVFRHPLISRTFRSEFKTLLKLSLLKRYSPVSEGKLTAQNKFNALLDSMSEVVQKASVLSGLVEPGSNIESEIKTVTTDSLQSACFVEISHAEDIINAEGDKVNKLIDAFVSSSANLVTRWNKFTKTFVALTVRALRSSETYHIRSMMRPADHMRESWLKESNLNELRRSSETIPKQSAADQLLAKAKSIPKAELPKYFVSFTKLEKLGINPGSTYDTPNGIYAYPLAYVVKQIKAGIKEVPSYMQKNGLRLSSVVPFAGGSPFVNIFRTDGNVLDLADREECAHQFKRIAKEAGLTNGEGTFKLPKAYMQTTPSRALWSLLLYLSNGKSETPDSNPSIAVKWNAVMRKFGFDGFVDSKGQGIIHSNEPTQAVFTQLPGLKDITRITNTVKGDTKKSETMDSNLNELPWVTTAISKFVNTTEFKTLFKSAASFIRAGDSEAYFPENVLAAANDRFNSMFSDLEQMPEQTSSSPLSRGLSTSFDKAFMKTMRSYSARRNDAKPMYQNDRKAEMPINQVKGNERAVVQLIQNFKKEVFQTLLRLNIAKRLQNHYDKTYDAAPVLEILGDMKPIFIKKAFITLLHIAAKANDYNSEIRKLVKVFTDKYSKTTMETILTDSLVMRELARARNYEN